jgi:hypothetical protein
MAFTIIDSDTSWQDLAIAAEIAASYNLRRLVFGLSAVAVPTDATKVFDFVSALQDGIEEMMGYDYYGLGAYYGWLLNTAALSTYKNQSSYPSPMTVSQAMTAAGLTASGYWRRIADSGTQPETWTNYAATGWSYGKIQDKDLAGPWLFKDIQLALSALTRVKLRHTQGRIKSGSASGTTSIPSTAISWGSWSSSGRQGDYRVTKRKSGTSVDYADAGLDIAENRFDIDADLSAYESDKLLLTIPFDGDASYGGKAAKMTYANLDVADISTAFSKTVSNTVTSSISGGTLSYYGVMAEDASNLIPLANNILPDANVPADTTISVRLYTDIPSLIIDFTFE